MLTQGAAAVLVPWVLGLLVIEMLIDVTALAGAALWWKHGTLPTTRLALRAGAAAALVHAGRVLIFVLGRTGPWIDFDVRPEQRASHAERWTWGEVYFAATLATLGVIGVIVIWQARRRSARARRSGHDESTAT